MRSTGKQDPVKIHTFPLVIRCSHTRWLKGWMDRDTFSTCHSWCFVCIACLFAIDYILLDSATESDDGSVMGHLIPSSLIPLLPFFLPFLLFHSFLFPFFFFSLNRSLYHSHSHRCSFSPSLVSSIHT